MLEFDAFGQIGDASKARNIMMNWDHTHNPTTGIRSWHRLGAADSSRDQETSR
jgi:hypothetical protein